MKNECCVAFSGEFSNYSKVRNQQIADVEYAINLACEKGIKKFNLSLYSDFQAWCCYQVLQKFTKNYDIKITVFLLANVKQKTYFQQELADALSKIVALGKGRLVCTSDNQESKDIRFKSADIIITPEFNRSKMIASL